MIVDKQLQLPSPVTKFLFENNYGCQLFIKREELIHPDFGGNKWRKLKYNIEEFKRGNYSRIITFGGAFSNHIAATAKICLANKIPCTGIIRGELSDPRNPTLNAAKKAEMELIHVSRSEYSLKEKSEIFTQLIKKYEQPFVIPEGGSNAYAIRGVSELVSELEIQGLICDYIVVSAGTGMTASGIISATPKSTKVVVINALKNKGLSKAIESFLPFSATNWEINSDYTFGGFAKVTDELIQFADDIFARYQLRLDPIYNAKAFYGTLDLIEKGYFPADARILYVCTGGLQGITAYNYMAKSDSKRLSY